MADEAAASVFGAAVAAVFFVGIGLFMDIGAHAQDRTILRWRGIPINPRPMFLDEGRAPNCGQGMRSSVGKERAGEAWDDFMEAFALTPAVDVELVDESRRS